MKHFSLYILLSLFLLLPTTLAHENQLSGLVYMQPQTPIPEQTFTLTLELVDPEGAYIPNAIVNLSIPTLNLDKRFMETDYTGVYTMELTLPEGKWLSDITEATFENESNTIQFGLNIGKENREIIELLFPVMETGKRSIPRVVMLTGLGIVPLLLLFILIYRFKFYSLVLSFSKRQADELA